MFRVWFENPWALCWLASLPVLVVLWLRGGAWRLRMLARFGRPLAVHRLLHVSESRRRFAALSVLVGLAAVIIALAGPRWGRTPIAAGQGHEVVVVLDLSRSMLAEQPSRQEKAFHFLRRLAEDLEESGRHRVGLVVFASHPQLRFPLTPDLEHLRFAMTQLDAARPPQSLRASDENTPSGTRIGAALQLGLTSFSKPRPGRQHLLFISDGDDPAEDDEWLQGAQEARRVGVATHVVAIGDATRDYPIPVGGETLRYFGKSVGTRLQVQPLEEIARRTGGRYFATGTGRLSILPTLESDWRTLPPEVPAVEPSTFASAPPVWLLALAILGLIGSMAIGERIRPRSPRPAWIVAAIAMLSLAAAPADPGDDALRRGNEAFAANNFSAALDWYDKALQTTNDPGRIAFNRAATLFRMKRYSEAELAYRQSLEDTEAPPERRARAHYDRGTALLELAESKNRIPLEKAVASFQECLRLARNADLKKDAQHNLEVALLALRRQPPDTPDPNNSQQQNPPRRPKQPPENKGGNTTNTLPNGSEPGALDKGGDPLSQKGGRKKLGSGPLTILPDTDKFTPLSREETLAHLERLQQRLQAARSAPSVPSPHIKDW